MKHFFVLGWVLLACWFSNQIRGLGGRNPDLWSCQFESVWPIVIARTQEFRFLGFITGYLSLYEWASTFHLSASTYL